MATISSASAVYALSATATPTKTNVAGSLTIGVPTTQVRYPDANVAYSMRAVFTGDGTAALNMLTGSTTGTTAFVAGSAQIETATAVGEITTAGNAEVVVIATGLPGAEKTFSVPVALSDTAADWAGKVRNALAADSDITALFTVSGSTTSIILTRKPLATFTIGGEVVTIFAPWISSLNISIDNDTCEGITAAPTSADTANGTPSEGVKLYDADGKDLQGSDLVAISALRGVVFKNNGPGTVRVTGTSDDYPIGSGMAVPFISDGSTALNLDTAITITPTGACDLTITVIGESA
jgi:hypothetical protein